MEEFSKIMADSLSVILSTRQNAENTLNSLVLDVGTMNTFFIYINTQSVPSQLKQAAAIFLMRYIKDYWYDDTEKSLEQPHKRISNDTKKYFQENILNLMFITKTDPKLMPILKNSIISFILDGQGYLNAWPEIMNILGNILKDKNHLISIDIYDLIQKIIKRYRSEFKSNQLITEIIMTIDDIAKIFTEDGVHCINYFFSQNINNKETNLLYLNILNHILNIFISINSVDFPEFFEDNLETWMKILNGAVTFELPTNDPQIFKLFIKVKKTSLRALNLYCSNYYEDFINYHDSFIQPVWNLLGLIKHEATYEKLIKELLDYYKILFQYNRIGTFSADSIKYLVDFLIIPEMALSCKELDDYEDNPINFLKIELEEVDMDSNKYHAINLLKGIIKAYPELTNTYIQPKINGFLSNYYSNPSKNWMDKIIAINLIFATIIKTFAQRIGATNVSVKLEELTGLIQDVFIKEINEVVNSNPIAKIYSLKFLSTFRLQVPNEWLSSIINMIVNILKNSDEVIQNASLLTLEKILFMRDPVSSASLTKNAVNTQETFVELINTLVKFSSTNINLFAIRCLYRTIFLTEEGYYKFVIETLSSCLADNLKIVIANPRSEDQYNYFLFETIAMLLKKLHTVDIELYKYFDKVINPNFLFILENNMTDLIAYVIQIFTLQLEYLVDPSTDDIHKNLLNSVLFDDNNWTLPMKYMFNPFTSYLKATLLKFSYIFINNSNYLDAVFKIVNKLLELRNFSLAFGILDQLLCVFELNVINNHIVQLTSVFINIYSSLQQNNKKAYVEFCKILVVFLSKLVIKVDTKYLIGLIESVAQGQTVTILIDLSQYLMDLDDLKNKKAVLYAFCSLLVDYYSSFGLETVKGFFLKLIEHLEKFHKFKLSNLGQNIDKLIDPGHDLSYTANNYNKLINAEIKNEKTIIDKIKDLDENLLLLETNEKIKSLTGVDLISQVFENLKPREKDYIQNAFKNYSKN